jgi:hypothetical protein
MTPLLQRICPQIHRTRPDCDEPEGTPELARILQDEKV